MMNILLTTLDYMILSVVLILISFGLIVLIYILIKKENIRYKKSKYSTLSNIVTYEDLEKLIEHRLEEKNQVYFSLLYISIDHFEQISEYIHEDGVYEYLTNVGKIIQMQLPKGSKFAQTKERETFMIYIPNLMEDDELYNLALNFKLSLEKRILITSDIRISRTFSISAVTFPKNGSSINKLLEALRASLYHAKRLGGNSISIFNESMLQNKEEFNKYKEFKLAIKNKLINFEFYPLFDSDGSKCFGFEANILYKRKNEILNYTDFMPNLEASNDIYWFGAWAFERIIEQSFDMYQTTVNKEIYVFIKVSIEQLENTDTVNMFDNIMKKYKVDHAKIVLYIPKLIKENISANIVKSLISLKRLGFKTAVDYQENYKLLKEMITNFELNFLKISIDSLPLLNDNYKKDLQNIEILLTNIDNVDGLKLASQKQIPFLQGTYFGHSLLSEELLPFISKNRL